MNPSVFVLGAGLNGLWVARSLGRHRIPVRLVATEGSDIAYHSRYVSDVTKVDRGRPEALASRLINAAASIDHRPVLIVTSDYFLLHVARAARHLEPHFLMNIPDVAVVETVVDKRKFDRFCQRHDLPSPAAWHVASEEELSTLSRSIEYPVAIKPAHSLKWRNEQLNRNGIKMLLANSEVDLRSILATSGLDHSDLALQQFIPGSDDEHYSYYAYVDRSGKRLVGQSVRKYRLMPIHQGNGTFLQVVEDEKLSSVGNEVLSLLNYRGAASVCFKRDSRTGNAVVYEVNGRLPLGHSVLQAAGIDLPFLMYRDLLMSEVPRYSVKHKNAKWVSLESDLEALAAYRDEGSLTFVQWLRSLNGTRMCAEFARDDLGPFVWALRKVLGRVGRKGVAFSRSVLGERPIRRLRLSRFLRKGRTPKAGLG